jgi:hypothetical protein
MTPSRYGLPTTNSRPIHSKRTRSTSQLQRLYCLPTIITSIQHPTRRVSTTWQACSSCTSNLLVETPKIPPTPPIRLRAGRVTLSSATDRSPITSRVHPSEDFQCCDCLRPYTCASHRITLPIKQGRCRQWEPCAEVSVSALPKQGQGKEIWFADGRRTLW